MHRYRFSYFFVLCLTLICAQPTYAQMLETQKWDKWNALSTPVFPAAHWQQYETAEEAGWSSAKLAEVQKLLYVAGSAAVMVIYDGAVLAQWGQTERRYKCHSMRKSILSALYGIAVADGNIELEETIGSIGIDDDLGLTALEKTAKISDLIKARSGVYHPAAYESARMKKSRPTRGSHEPGTHWYYNNWDFNALATIYNKKTQGDLFESFLNKIAVPLQMQDFELRHTYYHLEPENSRHAAYPFRMSARDLARFGLLFLAEGRWRNKTIIPADWVRESTKAQSTYSGGGYGYMWWTAAGLLGDLGAYAAFGYGGHSIYVVPKAKLVFVHRADTYGIKHVSNSWVRYILIQVLRARSGPPHPDPKLATLDGSMPVTPGPRLSKEQMSPYIGDYRTGRFAVTVRENDGRLEISSPRWGDFFLIQKSSTEYLVEDAHKRVEFELDPSGRASAMRIWFSADKPKNMRRVQ